MPGTKLFVLSRFSLAQLFGTPWPLPARLLCSWNSPGRITGVDCRFPLQGFFPTLGWNLGLPLCRQILLPLTPPPPAPPGSPLYYIDSNPFFGHTPTLPWQGVKPRSPQWNREVLITGSPGNSLESLIKKTSVNYIRAIWVEFIQCLTLYKIAQGNNFSDTSEKLLWRCEAGARIYEFFCCEKTCSRSPKMSVNHRTGKSG